MIEWQHLLNLVVQCVVFSSVGLVMFGVAFFVIDKLSPFPIRKEIEQDHNTALGLLIGSMIIGIAIIIAAAIGG